MRSWNGARRPDLVSIASRGAPQARVGLVDDFSLAEELVRDAGTLASSMLNEGLETHYKTSVSDVVSAADHAAEELVIGRLRTLRPDDGLIGEEGSKSPGDGRTWYV